MVGAWEFVPHVGVIVPQELDKADGNFVFARDVYLKQIERYRREFTRFLRKHLGLKKVASSSEILSRVQGLMNNLNWSFDTSLYPYDLATVEGTRRMTDDVFSAFADGTAPAGNGADDGFDRGMTFQLKPEIAEKILKQAPPRNLIMQLGCRNVGGLLQEMEPNNALGMASWTDRQLYLEQILDIIEKDGDRSWFHLAPLESVVVDLNRMTNLTELRGITALARLAGRVMVGSMQKGWGGEYPKLWFMLSLAKTIVGAEQFSNIWQRYAVEKSDFAQRLSRPCAVIGAVMF